MNDILSKILGANWRTSLSGIGAILAAGLTFLSGLSYDLGPLALIIKPEWKPTILWVAGLATVILWAWNSIAQKSKEVTGGSIQQTASGAVAKTGTQGLVDETMKASRDSGEQLTPEQNVGANTVK